MRATRQLLVGALVVLVVGTLGVYGVSTHWAPMGADQGNTLPTATSSDKPIDEGRSSTRLVQRGERLTLEAAAGQTVYGETALPAGTTLTVRLSSSEGTPFLQSREVTVDESGTFATSFDLAKVPVGTEFEATVHRSNGTRLDSTDGTVVEPTGVRIRTEGGQLNLSTAPGTLIRGTAPLPAGTTLTVRVHGEGAHPFIVSRETTVTEDGSFAATVDLPDVPSGTTVRVIVLDGNRARLAQTSATIVE